jgi:hypothetical protein
MHRRIATAYHANAWLWIAAILSQRQDRAARRCARSRMVRIDNGQPERWRHPEKRMRRADSMHVGCNASRCAATSCGTCTQRMRRSVLHRGRCISPLHRVCRIATRITNTDCQRMRRCR